MKAIGKLDWAFSAGRIPFEGTGEISKFDSHDKIAVLNTSDEEATLEFFIFYEDEKPVGAYKIKLAAKRLQKIRFNDIIDPLPVNLERNYSCYLKSDVPVVVQFSRMNTGANANAEMGTMAFPVDS